MKKKSIIKKASLVALSAVMCCGTAVAFAGCGGNSDLTLSVSIFCNDQDKITNEAICKNWAKEYTQKLVADGTFEEGEEIQIAFSSQSNTETYFSNLSNQIGSNNAPDIFYVSPKYVKVWTKLGRILDLTEYFEKTEEMAETLSDIWEDSLGFYGFTDAAGYMQGERISYDKDSGTFKTASGVTAGVYGLPKDYSNFGLGFNNKFFSERMREEYTTRKATDERTVAGAEYNTKDISNRGGSNEEEVITYAVDPDGAGPLEAGDPAPIINIGIPTTYKPYNFYSYSNYDEALTGGDPMANAVEDITGGEGYTVTIPGFPGDTFEMPENMQAENAIYDATKGHITYSFSEYGALTWALTYYLNTFAWDNNQADPLGGTNAHGGAINATGEWKNVYGNDQYDGVLYLLPWLAGNDANYIDSTSTKVVNGSTANAIGTETETIKKLDINGNLSDKTVQYGVNSANYIETYGAFLAYGSDWNGNSNNAGDTSETKLSGWDLFCAGSCIFYGAGTWDASTRNQSQYKYLEFRQMPEPVGDKYSLYSKVKDANYSGELKEYAYNEEGNPLKVYTQAEIEANQAIRQDKWGARMDSVGYGVNAETKKLEGKAAWKAAGAASLVMELAINKDVQKTLTYSGAQLPNFKSQCVEFLNYQEEGYENASFKDMITPDGSATVKGDAGKALWNEYLGIVEAMYAAKQANATDTIQAWMEANYSGKTYDAAFAADSISTVENRAYAMKVLCMTTYTWEDRDLSLRMQSGLNAVRDSSMYTYETGWLSKLEGRGNNFLMAYTMQASILDTNGNLTHDLVSDIVRDANILETNNRFATPQWFCLTRAQEAQTELDLAISHEKMALGE